MKRRAIPSRALLSLADAQHGALSRDEVVRSGLSRRGVDRLVAEGRWQRTARGLIFVGPQQPPWMALASGGILLGGENSRLAGASATFLHQWQVEAPSKIHVLVPHGLKLRATGCWTFPQERAGIRGRSVGHPPRTTAADTLLDLIQASQDEGRCHQPDDLRHAVW